MSSETKEAKNYIDDLELTRLLIEEINNRKNLIKSGSEKLPGPSNQLGAWYIKVVDRLLTKHNFRGYSDNYKDEFKSSAYLFFARYWWKFDPSRVKGNIDKELLELAEIQEETEEIENSVPLKEELKGGFTFFTTLAWTGILAALKVLKLNDAFRKKMAELKTKTSESEINSDFYTDRVGSYDL